jgi:hypothetical protein
MPLYFFNVQNGFETPDQAGTSFLTSVQLGLEQPPPVGNKSLQLPLP